MTCTYVADEAAIRVQSTRAMMIFDPELLKSSRWLADEWFGPKYERKGLTLTDAYGRVLPLGESYVYLQLSIIPLQTQDT